MSHRTFIVFAAAFVVGAAVLPAAAQTGQNVLIVANGSSPASLEIADYYAAKRQVPSDQIVRISTPVAEEISRQTYEQQIELPVLEWLLAHAAQDRILYIVLTKGVPLRISGTGGTNGTMSSVDSELTLVYRKFLGQVFNPAGSLRNPYFLGDEAISSAKPFSRRDGDIYLVARLDAYTVADVKGLIDRGSAPSKQGRILLDARAELQASQGNQWLDRAAATLKQLPGWDARVLYDKSPMPLRKESDVLGYFSWGSNDPLMFAREPGLQFVPGAIAGMFVSTDGRTMEEPVEGWQIRGAAHGGSTQSLAGDLIRAGVTGVSGHVAEPYLAQTIRPDILLPAYVAGFNLIESFYLAMPSLSWQTIVIGDPLCAPFRQHGVAAADIDGGVDPETEVPAFLAIRRVAVLTKAGLNAEVAKLTLTADARLLKRDTAGARLALEKATEIDDGFVPGHLKLATMYEAESQWKPAMDRYRRILTSQPNNVVALNNLAYNLAEHANAAAEALPLAKQANDLGKGAPVVADTLAWVYHRLHRDAEAEPLASLASQKAPKAADIQVHAAVIFAAVGKRKEAAEALQTALALDNRLESHAEVVQLRRQLQNSK